MGIIVNRSRVENGLRIHGRNGHPKVRDSLIRFAKWLRQEKSFPIRVNVYLSALPFIIAKNGEKCTGLIWIPDATDRFPYIRIATGDFELQMKKLGRDNALAGHLCTLSHELIHYWQWIETDDLWELGVSRKAARLVDQYAQTTNHP
jgi:hypothetical protein